MSSDTNRRNDGRPHAEQGAAVLGRAGARPRGASPGCRRVACLPQPFGWLRLPDQERIVAVHDELPEAERGYFDEATQESLLEFQRFYRLPATGTVNPETLALMRRPRCGVPDKAPAAPAGDGAVNFVAGPTKWSNIRPGYRLSQGTADLTNANVNAALFFAYRSWSLIAQIAAHPVSSGGDIDVRITTGNHGDGAGNAFDGVGTVLAHGFYPPPFGGNFGGDLHFDDAETWTRNLPPTGTDLDTVALHEGGHTLGLNHSDVAGAVMFAFYGGARRNLTADDIAGLRSIYGTRERNSLTNIDTAVEGEGPFAGKGYFFKGSRYLRYDYADDLPDPGYMREIGANWHGLPAGFTSNFDAAFNGQKGFAGKLYIFKGDQYVRYDWATDRTDPGYPKSIAANWHGPPGGVHEQLRHRRHRQGAVRRQGLPVQGRAVHPLRLGDRPDRSGLPQVDRGPVAGPTARVHLEPPGGDERSEGLRGQALLLQGRRLRALRLGRRPRRPRVPAADHVQLALRVSSGLRSSRA